MTGIWRRDSTYEPGDLATRGGSIWSYQITTTAEPGKDHDAWKLAVTQGRTMRLDQALAKTAASFDVFQEKNELQ